MGKIVSIHSFRGGTGKSNVTANLAAQAAMQGKRVGIVDTDIASPGIHVLFGMDKDSMGKTMNDYLNGKCSIVDAAYNVGTNTSSAPGLSQLQGKEIFFVIVLATGKGGKPAALTFNPARIEGTAALIE